MSLLGRSNGKHASLRVLKPQARTDELVVEEFGDELLIYDSENKRAHSLGPIAASVWRACDGTHDADALAAKLELSGFDTSRALDELEALGLLERQGIDVLQSGSTSGDDSGITRRQMTMRSVKAGAAVVTVPLVYSINVNPALATLTPTPFQCELFTTQDCGSSQGCGSIFGCCCCCQGGGACKTCGSISACNTPNTQPCAPIQNTTGQFPYGTGCSNAKGTYPADPAGCCGVSGAMQCGCGWGPFAGCCTKTGDTTVGAPCTPGAENCVPCCKTSGGTNNSLIVTSMSLGCCKSNVVDCCLNPNEACCQKSSQTVDCCANPNTACCKTTAGCGP